LEKIKKINGDEGELDLHYLIALNVGNWIGSDLTRSSYSCKTWPIY